MRIYMGHNIYIFMFFAHTENSIHIPIFQISFSPIFKSYEFQVHDKKKKKKQLIMSRNQ